MIYKYINSPRDRLAIIENPPLGPLLPLFHPSSSDVTLPTGKMPKLLSRYYFYSHDGLLRKDYHIFLSVLLLLLCWRCAQSSVQQLVFKLFTLWVKVLLVLLYTAWEVTLLLTLPSLQHISLRFVLFRPPGNRTCMANASQFLLVLIADLIHLLEQ